MRHEFEVNLKPVRPRPCTDLSPQPAKPYVPPLRRTLVLAYQIVEYVNKNDLRSMADFCRQAHITSPRATQILALLLLSPRIQEQILVGGDAALKGVREETLRPNLKEIVWADQEKAWKKLLSQNE
jgi:hypothetical protein